MRVPPFLKSLLASALVVSAIAGVDATKPCVSVTIRNDNSPSSASSSPIQDGRIVTAVVKLDESFASNPPAEVEISAPGIHFGRTTFKFNKHDKSSFEQVVTCRSDAGSAPGKDGAVVAVPVTLAYKQGPVPKETQTLQRQVVSAGRCSGWGDPHLTTFDGVAYDFQSAGVFRLVEAGNFQVQIFQDKCGPVARLKDAAPSCYQGVAVAFGASVARFLIVDGKIQVAKASPGLQWLSVEKLATRNADGYRVFTNVDHATYVDINLATWDAYNFPYLNVALQVSPYFKRSGAVSGLMGNWNGDKRDDITDNTKLASLHGVGLANNLFTCVNDACAPLLKPSTLEDSNALGLPTDQPLLHQGYAVISAGAIPLQAFTPTLKPIARRRLDNGAMDQYVAGRVETADVATGTNGSVTAQPLEDGNVTATTATTATSVEDVTARATQLCTQVIASLATCTKYVRETAYFVSHVCVADAALLQDLSVVDNAKLTYLRECRRELDARLEADLTGAAETKALRDDRAALLFGDLTQCAKNCSGRGECLAAGCKCHAGFTGHGCELAL